MIEYFLLFASAFSSATLLPGSSEVAFILLLENKYDPILLFIVATIGNTLGSVINWLLGRYFLHYQDRTWFPVKKEKLKKAQNWFNRFGVYSLLLGWLPVVGDAITLLAGVMRTRFLLFFVLTLVGKASRYGVLAAIYFGLF